MFNNIEIKNYQEYVENLMIEGHIPGVVVGISQNDELLYGKGFGYRDVAGQLGTSLDTVFCIGSITKSFTCVAIMQLQEAGKLSVHNPVNEYLPEFRLKGSGANEQMTIHHFMTHTTGVPPMPFMGDSLVRAMNEDLTEDQTILKPITNKEEPTTYIDLMDGIAQLDIELLESPGTIFSYSNECYALLGAIIERTSGVPYETYVRENILKPAGMNHSSFFHKDLSHHEDITNPYVKYTQDGVVDVIVSPKWWDAPAMRATGLLNSTVRDMLKYSELFYSEGLVGTERILSSVSVKQMLTPYVIRNVGPGTGKLNQYYGYGLTISYDLQGSTLIEHSGNGKGVSAMMQIVLERGLAGIGLSNLSMSPISGIVTSMMNISMNRPLEYSWLDGNNDFYIPKETLDQYVGNYYSGDRGVVSIKSSEGRLILSSRTGMNTLEGLDNDIFKIRTGGTYNTIQFFRDSNNQVIRVSLSGRIHVKE